MFLGLNSLLNIKESEAVKGKFVLVSEDQNDASFVIHYFLSHYIKAGFNVCFIALSQSLSHYSSVAQKLGVNLPSACENSQVKYIDGLKQISISSCETDLTDVGNPFHNIRNPQFTLQPLYNQVKTFVCQSSEPCLVLVDDVAVLLSLGVPLQRILDFCSYCTNLMCYSTTVTDGCFTCLVHCDSDIDDDESMLLWKQLSHTAHVELHIEGLSSGYCKDVHGQLVVTEKDDFGLTSPRKAINQFKIQDRVINFFAPGTSKAVL